MPQEFLLYGHAGCFNHGAEALTRCTIALLRREVPGCRVIVSTHFRQQDERYALGADEYIERDRGATNEDAYRPTMARMRPGMVCLCVGGDQYCYRNWQRWSMLHEAARRAGARSVLWSCSIDPDAIDRDMLDALRGHDLIAAREGVTYEALVARGLTNVVRVSDIAFGLAPEAVGARFDAFELWGAGDAAGAGGSAVIGGSAGAGGSAGIGGRDAGRMVARPIGYTARIPFDAGYVALNASPLVLRRNPIAARAYARLIDVICAETDLAIALVPHVMAPVDNDMDALRMLASGVGGRGAVLVCDDLRAAQYKSIIAGARLCVAARTHVAIAAYSSCVPTLAIGYSAKSKGIAQDIGQAAHLIDIDALDDPDAIAAAFRALLASETATRQRLQEVMPAYIARAVHPDALRLLRGKHVA